MYRSSVLSMKITHQILQTFHFLLPFFLSSSTTSNTLFCFSFNCCCKCFVWFFPLISFFRVRVSNNFLQQTTKHKTRDSRTTMKKRRRRRTGTTMKTMKTMTISVTVNTSQKPLRASSAFRWGEACSLSILLCFFFFFSRKLPPQSLSQSLRSERGSKTSVNESKQKTNGN